MAQASKKWRRFVERVMNLHAMLGSTEAGERENARAAIDKLLARHKKTWNDVPDLLREALALQQPQRRDETGPEEELDVPNIFDLVYGVFRRYVHARSTAELVALALWTMHTFVFDRFSITPRLALLSPVRGCGKTVTMTLLSRLACRAERHDDPSEAVLYHTIDQDRPSLLIDEIDNQDRMARPGLMRSIFNSGYNEDGSVSRLIEGRPRRFSTFAPLALSGIGSLPLPLLQRCVLVQMQRAPRASGLERLDTKDVGQMRMLSAVHWYIQEWARQVTLDQDPTMPRELHNRRADNWRPLLAIADACERGEEARRASVALSLQHQDEDMVVELLGDIRTVFDNRKVDRLASGDLCGALCALEDRPWAEWRGRQDNRSPRTLSQSELAGLLSPFKILPKTVWPTGPRAHAKSRRGYMRADFELAWASYVDLQEPEDASGRKLRLRLV